MLIHEVVLGETLERPVHFSEKLLDLTLRWGSWQGNIALKYFHNIKKISQCVWYIHLYMTSLTTVCVVLLELITFMH